MHLEILIIHYVCVTCMLHKAALNTKKVNCVMSSLHYKIIMFSPFRGRNAEKRWEV